MLKTLSIAIICCGMFFTGSVCAHDYKSNDAKSILSFAEHLSSQGEYYRAITEYKRLLFLYPAHPERFEIKLKIGNCYMQGERWNEAISYFQLLLAEGQPEKISIKILYKFAESYYAIKKYNTARMYLQNLIDQFPDTKDADTARYLMADTYLKQYNWPKAAEVFAQINEKTYSGVKNLNQEILEAERLLYKSPGLAGVYSALIPGAGQLYAGRRQDAIVSFLLNGVFLWGIVESFQHDKEVAGGILLFFELGWYTGNIYSAITSTHKYNEKLKDDFYKGINSRLQFKLGSLKKDALVPYICLTYKF